MNENIHDLWFPLFGINVSTEFEMQPGSTCRDGVNVRANEPLELRMRGGSRPGTRKYIPQLVNGPFRVQLLDQVTYVDPSLLGYLEQQTRWASDPNGVPYPGPDGPGSGGVGPPGGSGSTPVKSVLPTGGGGGGGDSVGNVYPSKVRSVTAGGYSVYIPTQLGPVSVRILSGIGTLPENWNSAIIQLGSSYVAQPALFFEQ